MISGGLWFIDMSCNSYPGSAEECILAKRQKENNIEIRNLGCGLDHLILTQNISYYLSHVILNHLY